MGAVLKASTNFGEKRVVLVTNGLNTLSKCASIYMQKGYYTLFHSQSYVIMIG
jgi:hypothetical protein